MSINWNKVAVAAAIAGMSYVGVPTAQSAPPPPWAEPTESTIDCTSGGAETKRTATNGSTALHTSPATIAERRQYGPQVSPDMLWLVAD